MSTCIEYLESRIAPAKVLNATTILFQDYDGDLAKIQITTAGGLGAFLALDSAQLNKIFTFNTGAVDGTTTTAQQLLGIDLTQLPKTLKPFADGMNISVTVTPGGTGDGKVNVGYIEAGTPDPANSRFIPYADLNTVKIQGDLMSIDVGDTWSDPALGTLDVQSMGVFKTGDPRKDLTVDKLESQIFGPITNLHVRGDLASSTIRVIGSQYGDITNLRIDGTLGGSNNIDPSGGGQVVFQGTLQSGIVGSISGGEQKTDNTLVQTSSGAIRGIKGVAGPGGNIVSLEVKGSISGGSAAGSGQIEAIGIGVLKVGGDVLGGYGSGSGSVLVTGNAQSINIEGSINGSGGELSDLKAGISSGRVVVTGTLTNFHLGGDLVGGEASDSGEILAGIIGKARIDGGMYGNMGSYSGSVVAASIGTLMVDGSVQGGNFYYDPTANLSAAADHSGSIFVDSTKVKTVTGLDYSKAVSHNLNHLVISGNLKGGAGNSTGTVSVSGTLKDGSIGGNIQGGTNSNGSYTGSFSGTGYLTANRIGKLVVEGSLSAGGNENPGSQILFNSGAIRATVSIQNLTIGGNVLGDTATGTTRAVISAGGDIFKAGADTAIHNLDIKGTAALADILAGYVGNEFFAQDQLRDSAASIGKVHIGGDFLNSNIVAGVSAGDDGSFGSTDDTVGANSFIQSVVIDGHSRSLSALGGGTYGIVAHRIAEATANSAELALQPGPANDRLLISLLGDVWLSEVQITA